MEVKAGDQLTAPVRGRQGVSSNGVGIDRGLRM